MDELLPAKANSRRKLHRKIFKKIKESKWGTCFKSDLCESNILETQDIFPIYHMVVNH